ncbi:ras and Rab interactor 2 [Amia ocellicauda]|uniref:ras and Rab interactor 2 n=1 Tax=Amia ocellicauda TaxID=2972642 RepID=UPI00346457E9
MQEDPVYDFPEPQQREEPRPALRGSLKSISVLDRLLLTHPVWLQLSINSATALHILQREPPGTFLVRKSTTSQKKVLCMRLEDDSMPSFVKQFIIRAEDSTFSLESSAISFPDLCRLIAFYCVSRDVLPFPLQLPEAIAKATSHKQLESISHMGVEFWSSPLNFRGPRNGPPPPDPSPPTPEDCTTPQETPSLFQEFCPIRTRSPLELDCGAGQGALCFINPLFLQEQPSRGALHKRHQFKRSLKVRVSTETSSPLSPPAAPPPPPPLLDKGCRRKAGGGRGVEPNPAVQDPGAWAPPEVSDYMHPPCAPLKRGGVGALSPTTEEEDYQMPKALVQGREEEPQEASEEETVGLKASEEETVGLKASEEETVGLKASEEETVRLKTSEEDDGSLILEQRRVPSLNELDSSSSLSSLEEVEETPERPPLTRGTSSPAAPLSHQPVSALRKMSAAFICFFAPEKRVARLVEELSRDRRSAFGTLVQDFLRRQREAREGQESSAAMLQGLRLFLSEARNFLLESGELEPPIETLVPDEERDFTLEKALYRCVLKPLKPQIDTTLRTLHTRDGSTQLMADSLRRAQDGALARFGVRVGVPDAQGLERVRQKLGLMQRAYSPVDKVVLLLQACKCVYKAMRGVPGQECGADEFLPALSYVLVQCNMPELPLEVEYMMELLEPSWLMGEGGYYLTSVYASLSLIKSQLEAPPLGGLTQEARESLKKWTRRRNTEASQRASQHNQRFLRVLFQEGGCSTVKTLLCKAGDTSDTLAQVCAQKFGVAEPESYALYWRCGGETRALPPQTGPQDLLLQAAAGFSLTYQRCDTDAGKARKLTRGGAVDLGEQPEAQGM